MKIDWNYILKRFNLHVGEVNSIHNRCFDKILDFENQYQSIQVAFNKQTQKIRGEHQIRLEASTKVAKFLLDLDCLVRSHDETVIKK